MAKFSRTFRGVPDGEIYPREFAPGEECPKELEASARAQGCIEAAAKPGKKSTK